MERMYATGNDTVDRMARLQLTGNVIPQTWYQTIRKESGKPNLNAIVILADIVYWYRPVEIRDEGNGQLIGYKKRFKADLLQRSYQQISEQFGITKRDATNAIVELEKLGVVKRVFRSLHVNGLTVPNVLFLSLDADVLEQLTFPKTASGENCPVEKKEEEAAEEGISPKTEKGVTQIGDTCHPDHGGYPAQMGENTENTYKDYTREYPSSPIYQLTMGQFKEQIGYEELKQEHRGDPRLEELVSVAVDVLTSPAATIRVNREERPAYLVRAQFEKLTNEHVEYVLESLERAAQPMTNVRAVLITALYNAVATLNCYVGNLYRCNTVREKGG